MTSLRWEFHQISVGAGGQSTNMEEEGGVGATTGDMAHQEEEKGRGRLAREGGSGHQRRERRAARGRARERTRPKEENRRREERKGHC